MSNISTIADLISTDYDTKNTANFSSPITPHETIELERIGRACDNTESSLYAGLRVMSHMLYSTGVSEVGMDSNNINDLANYLGHISDELEAIGTTKSNLNFRRQQASH